MAYLVFRQLLVMLLLMAVSYLVARKKHYGEKESDFLSYLLLYVVSPALIIDAYNITFDPSKLKYMLLMAILSIISLMVTILLSHVFGKAKNDYEASYRDLSRIGVVYSNCGYIGIPLIQAVMGPDAVFYLMVYIVFFNTCMWIHGQYLMTKTFSLKAVITKPAVIAAVFAFLLFVSPWKLPYVVGETVHLFASLTTTLAMIVLGLLFADFKIPKGEKFPMRELVFLMVMRLVVVPLLFIVLLLPLRHFIGNNETIGILAMVIIVVGASPCGVCMSNLAVLYHKDYSYANVAVTLSTILCVITMPLFAALGEKLFLG